MMDGRIPRLWYLTKEWLTLSEVPSVEVYYDDPKRLEIQNVKGWPDIRKHYWSQIEKAPHIFVSRSPLTFCHSQLVVPASKNDEEDLFRVASKIIYTAISVFKNAFDSQVKPLHEKDAFKPLAEYTHTYGPYIKTLVLRASASEKTNKQYKVHLVPYFKSHASSCKSRFQSLHRVKPEETGGLLAWLGEREDEADKWEADPTPVKPLLDQIANDHMKMADLAQELRRLWPTK